MSLPSASNMLVLLEQTRNPFVTQRVEGFLSALKHGFIQTRTRSVTMLWEALPVEAEDVEAKMLVEERLRALGYAVSRRRETPEKFIVFIA